MKLSDMARELAGLFAITALTCVIAGWGAVAVALQRAQVLG